jgi:hypothetical protein
MILGWYPHVGKVKLETLDVELPVQSQQLLRNVVRYDLVQDTVAEDGRSLSLVLL